MWGTAGAGCAHAFRGTSIVDMAHSAGRPDEDVVPKPVHYLLRCFGIPLGALSLVVCRVIPLIEGSA